MADGQMVADDQVEADNPQGRMECAGSFWTLSPSEETDKGAKSLLLPVGVATSSCPAWNDRGPLPLVAMRTGCH